MANGPFFAKSPRRGFIRLSDMQADPTEPNFLGHNSGDLKWNHALSGVEILATQSFVQAFGIGQANTASNVGLSGVGIFEQKTGVDLELRNIFAASDKITVVLDAPDKTVDVDAVPDELEFVLVGQIFS